MCAAYVNNFSSNLVERVDFSDLRVALLWAGLYIFLINNRELKCSFVQCRKYHKSWSNGVAELHISVDLLCGTTVAELHNSVDLLCDTLAAELHNSVNLPFGTIDCLQSAFSLLNPSSSYLIQRDNHDVIITKGNEIFSSRAYALVSRGSPLMYLGFPCSNFAKKNKRLLAI